MRTIILAVFFISLSNVNAGVYTWIDQEGNTHFSDTPQEGAKKIKLKESTSYTPPTTPARKSDKNISNANKASVLYTEISIDQPENDSTVRTNEGKVAVSISTKPGLQAEHKIQIYLNDTKLGDPFSETGAIELQGVDRGSHNLAAAIIDKTGMELIRSTSVTFHLQKQSINLPTRKPTPSPRT